MQVGAIDSQVPVSQLDNIGAVVKALESLAKQHNTTVADLVKGAQAAGSSGLPYQIRALNLETRLEKLSKE